jgi:protein-disulfide isomerase
LNQHGRTAATLCAFQLMTLIVGCRQPISVTAGPAQIGDIVQLAAGRLRDGASAARVGVIEFSDFECPYCGEFSRLVLPGVRTRFIRPGTAWWEFRHFPLTIHRRAIKAATVASCAGRQGRFWEMHDALFAKPELWAEGSFGSTADVAGVSRRQLWWCSWTTSPQVNVDVRSGEALGVRTTPTFFVGTVEERGLRITHVIAGLPTAAFFDAAIRTAVAKATVAGVGRKQAFEGRFRPTVRRTVPPSVWPWVRLGTPPIGSPRPIRWNGVWCKASRSITTPRGSLDARWTKRASPRPQTTRNLARLLQQ